jgi:hypothetical protein
MQALRYRAGGILAAAAASLAALSAPAWAANTPPPVRCATDSSCFVELNWNVTYSGSSGGHNGVVITPPPCIGVPIGDAHTGSQAIISLYSDTGALPSQSPTPLDSTPPAGSAPPSDSVSPSDSASPGSSASAGPSPSATATTTASTTALITRFAPVLSGQQQAILNQAEQLVGSSPITPGEWYQISGNPHATTAAQAKCTNLPPFVWVNGANGTLHVAGLNIPAETLAGLAYSQLTTVGLGRVTLDPPGANDTNLPTFVEVTLRQPRRGVLAVTTKGVPYVWATAQTPAGAAATVYAWVTSLAITPGTSNAITYDQPRCQVAHPSATGLSYVIGSRYTQAEMKKVGVGQPIDCGVTYTAPGTYHLTANVTWNACWTTGLAVPGGPPAAGCKPVPGAAGLAPSTTAPVQVNVRDIQAVNNG